MKRAEIQMYFDALKSNYKIYQIQFATKKTEML